VDFARKCKKKSGGAKIAKKSFVALNKTFFGHTMDMPNEDSRNQLE